MTPSSYLRRLSAIIVLGFKIELYRIPIAIELLGQIVKSSVTNLPIIERR